MTAQAHYKIGTLISDMGKLGIIYRRIDAGTLNTEFALINWRFNYEIYYFDGGITVMGHSTLDRLVKNGTIEIIKDDESNYVIKEVQDEI